MFIMKIMITITVMITNTVMSMITNTAKGEDREHGQGRGQGGQGRGQGGQGRGQGQGHNHDHGPMLASVTDCQVIIAGGMGFPVVDAIQAQGMALVLSVETDISRILADYVAGNLVSNPRLAHRPGHHSHD